VLLPLGRRNDGGLHAVTDGNDGPRETGGHRSICSDCQRERNRWLDTRPSTLQPRLSITHGSGAPYDVSETGLRDNTRNRWEDWRSVVQRNIKIIADNCRTDKHVSREGEMTDYPNGFETPGPPEPRAAKKAGYVPGVSYDQYDRYVLPGDPEPWTRVTTISGFGTNTEGLRVWTERGIMSALAGWPAGRKTLAANPDDVKVHDELLKEAKQRAGLHDAAAEGTALHKELQRWVELGHNYQGPPPELADDVNAAVGKLADAGLSVVKVEALVTHPALRVAGRLDCLWHRTTPGAAGTLPRVGDWKSGKDVLNPSKRATFARQLAAYANAEFMLDPATGELVPMPEVDREYAWLMHVKDGRATLYRVPIAQAWLEFKAAAILHHGASAGGAPIFEPEGRTFETNVITASLPALPVTGPADWTTEQPAVSAGAECPSCGQLTAEVSPKDDWNCTSCQVYGAAYGEIMATRNVPAEDRETAIRQLQETAAELRAEIAANPEVLVNVMLPAGHISDEGPCAHGQWSRQADGTWTCGVCGAPGAGPAEMSQQEIINQTSGESPTYLAPMADKSQGQRGCGVCGRVGHKRGSPKCLGDADPARLARTSLDQIAEDQRVETGFHAASTPNYPDQVEFCDGRCEPQARLERDEKGRYRCAACGKPATVAAIRARVTGKVSPEVAAAALRTSEPTPPPPAQITPNAPQPAAELSAPMQEWLAMSDELDSAEPAEPAPPWLPAPAELAPDRWAHRFAASTDLEMLGVEVRRLQQLNEFDQAAQDAATERWRQLSSQGS
jgi:ribosomal protein L37AE/L43A